VGSGGELRVFENEEELGLKRVFEFCNWFD